MKVIAHANADGTIAITFPAYGDRHLRQKILVTGAVYEDQAILRDPSPEEKDKWVKEHGTEPPKKVEGVRRVLKEGPQYRDETDEEVVNRIAGKLGGAPLIVEDTDLPADRGVFRAAWRIVNKKVVIDLPTAKQLWVEKFTAIAKREKAVLPPTIHDEVSKATTLDELKRAWPPGLPRE